MKGNNILLTKKDIAQIAQQSQKKIKGTIVDAKGETIIGANVLVKGTTNGTITDLDGNFSLEVPPNATLLISYIGYIEQSIKVNEKSSFKVILKEDSQALDEVVVIGYGSVRKKDLTGAVAQVKTDQFSTEQATNMLQYLSGTVAGFNSNMGTEAKGGGSMEVRGPTSLNANNEPLIVLDGVIFNGSLNDINPTDIENIDILKDASSAAVYGSRSASGVVLVTTKRGKGDKLTINFSAQLGITDLTNHTLRAKNGEEYIQLRQDFLTRQNPDKPTDYFTNPNQLSEGLNVDDWQKYDVSYAQDPVDTWMNRLSLQDIEKENYKAGREYDWYEAGKQQGLRQNYDVSLSGGLGPLRYYWSLGSTDNKGYKAGDEYKIIRSRINTEANVTDYLKVGLNAQFSSKDENDFTFDWAGIFKQSPYGQPYDEEGELVWYPHNDPIGINPFMYTKMDDFHKTQNLFATLYADLKLPFGFSYRVSYINRYDWEKEYSYNPSSTVEGNKVGGQGSRQNNSLYEWQVDNILTWKKTFGIHDFNGTLLYNAEKKQTWLDLGQNIGFTPSESLGFHQLNAGLSPTIINTDTYSTGNAIMGRINYGLLDKYMLTASIRRDGYSAFGKDNQYATFPSAALAWTVSKEDFFHISWMDFLKVRASYGLNGNRDIGIYDSLSKLSVVKYLSGSNLISGVTTSSMANSLLKWEKTKAINLGIDFSIFNGRLSGDIEYYATITNDLLMNRSLPTIIGFSNVMSNMGELQNKGFEMTLKSQNMKTKDFSWNSQFVFSLNRNKITHLYGEMIDELDEAGNVIGQREADDITNKWFIGQSIDRIWDYKMLGIYQTGEEEAAKSFGKQPGDIKLLDVDGNGVSSQEDKIFQGYTKPRFNLGLRNDINFLQNFNLSFFIRAELGQSKMNSLLIHTSQTLDRRSEINRPYWTPSNANENYSRLNIVYTPTYIPYENCSFVRLQDLSLGYTLPHNLLTYMHINRAKVYVSSRNLITISGWSGWDPESGNTPMPRLFTFGIDVTL